MFKKPIIIASIIASLALTGCSGIDWNQVAAVAFAVIADAQSVCHATVDDSQGAIDQLIATYPHGTSALTIATDVCKVIQAVPPAAAREAPVGASGVTVNGVVIPYVRTN